MQLPVCKLASRPCTTAQQQRPLRSSVSAAAGAPLISLNRIQDSGTLATVIERRAADVCVVGGSCTATLAAYSLAKAGKKVVLLPSFGLSAPATEDNTTQPLKLTDTDPLLVHLTAEASAYWRGLELLAGSPLLSAHNTCDVVLNPETDHPGAQGFSLLQEACSAADVATAQLSSSELMTRFRQLQLPLDACGVLQTDGGVLHAADTSTAALTLAERVGVVNRSGLVLRGWRDRGSCFQLRASSPLTPELLTEIEAEVLLLAPNNMHNSCLRLFGLQLEGLKLLEVLSCHAPAGFLQQQPEQQPVWQSWGAAAAVDAPNQPQAVCALPLTQQGAASGWLLQQLPGWGVEVTDPLKWQPAVQAWSQSRQQQAEAGYSRQEQQRTSCSSSSWVDMQVKQLHDTCQQLTRGMGPLDAVRPNSSLRNCTPDGRHIIGQHPGFDAGRVIIACGATGTRQYGPGSTSSSYQLSPILAKLSADLVKSAGGSGDGSAELQGLGLGREGLQPVLEPAVDTWEGLKTLQQAQELLPEHLERQQDEATDQRQDRANLDLPH